MVAVAGWSMRPIFTKRHYEAIADTIRIYRAFSTDDEIEDLAATFARMFRNDNSGFKREVFYARCGVPRYNQALRLPEGL